MKKYILVALLALITAAVSSTRLSAQNRRVAGGRSDSLSVEQRKAFRQQLQARYDSLSPEQKKEIRKKMRSRLDSLPPGEKKQMRKQFMQKYRQLSPEDRKQIREDVLNAADSAGQKQVKRRKGVEE